MPAIYRHGLAGLMPITLSMLVFVLARAASSLAPSVVPETAAAFLWFAWLATVAIAIMLLVDQPGWLYPKSLREVDTRAPSVTETGLFAPISRYGDVPLPVWWSFWVLLIGLAAAVPLLHLPSNVLVVSLLAMAALLRARPRGRNRPPR
jgi:hypothetical protein